MCGQHNVRASAEDNTDRTQIKDTHPNPRTEINIPDPAGNRTWVAGLEGRDSTDHATATDGLLVSEILIFKLILVRKFLNIPRVLGFEVKY